MLDCGSLNWGFSIRVMPGLNLSSASEGLPESCHRFGDALRFVLGSLLMFAIAPKAAAQALSSEARASLRRGEVALDQGDFGGAIVALERARELAPNRPEALRPLLLAYLQAGQIPKAVRVGREATAAWPEDAELHHWLGLAYFKTEQNPEARQELQKSETLNGGNFATHFDLALVLLTMQDYASAGRQLERALGIRPSDALAHLLLGRAYQNTNRSEDAIHQFQTALHLDSGVPLGHYHLGFAYQSVGQIQSALDLPNTLVCEPQVVVPERHSGVQVQRSLKLMNCVFGAVGVLVGTAQEQMSQRVGWADS